MTPITPVLTISRARAAQLLFGSVIVVQLLNLPALVFRYVWDMPGATAYITFFAVSDEGKVPTFVSGVTILMGAVLLAAIAAHEWRGRFGRHWLALALIFVFLAFDEMLVVHELTMAPLRRAFGVTSGPLYFAWVIPAAFLLALFGVAFLRFLQALPRRFAGAFIGAGLVYVAGALGMELVSGAYITARGDDLIYGLMTAVEETGEMAGMAWFVTSLLDYLASTAPEWRIRLTATGND